MEKKEILNVNAGVECCSEGSSSPVEETDAEICKTDATTGEYAVLENTEAASIYDTTDAVTVISCSPQAWITSSSTMGRNMAVAMQRSGSYSVKCPTNKDVFETYWNNAGTCVVIHTHGSYGGLFDERNGSTPQIISLDEIKQLDRNNNINFVVITSCSTAGGAEDNNVACWISQKINQYGIVIANKYDVSGGDTEFSAANGLRGWVIYRNGNIITSPRILTMPKAYEIFIECAN